MTKSQNVEVDEWLIGGGSIELNPNTPRSASELCTLIADGDDEEDGIYERNRGVVKRVRSYGGKYGGWGPDARLLSVSEGDKDEDAFREDVRRVPRFLALAAL